MNSKTKSTTSASVERNGTYVLRTSEGSIIQNETELGGRRDKVGALPFDTRAFFKAKVGETRTLHLQTSKPHQQSCLPNPYNHFLEAVRVTRATRLDEMRGWLVRACNITFLYGMTLKGVRPSQPIPQHVSDDMLPATSSLNADLMRWLCNMTCSATYSREQILRRTQSTTRYRIVGNLIIAAIIDWVWDDREFPPSDLETVWRKYEKSIPSDRRQDPGEYARIVNDWWAMTRRFASMELMKDPDFLDKVVPKRAKCLTQKLRVTMAPFISMHAVEEVDKLFKEVEVLFCSGLQAHLANQLQRDPFQIYWPREDAVEHLELSRHPRPGEKIVFVFRPAILALGFDGREYHHYARCTNGCAPGF